MQLSFFVKSCLIEDLPFLIGNQQCIIFKFFSFLIVLPNINPCNGKVIKVSSFYTTKIMGSLCHHYFYLLISFHLGYLPTSHHMKNYTSILQSPSLSHLMIFGFLFDVVCPKNLINFYPELFLQFLWDIQPLRRGVPYMMFKIIGFLVNTHVVF